MNSGWSLDRLWMMCASSLSNRKHCPADTSVMVPPASTWAVPLITTDSSRSGWRSCGLLDAGGTVYHIAWNGMVSPSPNCSQRTTSTTPTVYDSAESLTNRRIEKSIHVDGHRIDALACFRNRNPYRKVARYRRASASLAD